MAPMAIARSLAPFLADAAVETRELPCRVASPFSGAADLFLKVAGRDNAIRHGHPRK
ncbi:hypothetical protein E4U42_004914 [Claviceps africana]|uniref:Uncharacterized protein n=1 Tax=Claviceps africana TaxID=83212 RepID=A0A8K0J6R0_9HYPO|nr:hypothetical protein E4U42_004914 [Claviceps africana]